MKRHVIVTIRTDDKEFRSLRTVTSVPSHATSAQANFDHARNFHEKTEEAPVPLPGLATGPQLQLASI